MKLPDTVLLITNTLCIILFSHIEYLLVGDETGLLKALNSAIVLLFATSIGLAACTVTELIQGPGRSKSK